MIATGTMESVERITGVTPYTFYLQLLLFYLYWAPLSFIMKNIACTLYLFLAALFVNAQNSNTVKEINQLITPASALAPLRFLASDELMGRGSLRPEINIAARYISEEFRNMGVKEVPGSNDYYQTFDLRMRKAATTGTLIVNGNTYDMMNKLLQVQGGDTVINAPVVYANHGTENDLNTINVKGKIVITESGTSDSNSF